MICKFRALFWIAVVVVDVVLTTICFAKEI